MCVKLCFAPENDRMGALGKVARSCNLKLKLMLSVLGTGAPLPDGAHINAKNGLIKIVRI
jgi:hypothetical protein